MKELQHEYFPHDYNASGDENMVRLLRALGSLGTGIYWRIVERLYQSEGQLLADYDLLAYALREEAKTIARVVGEFDLFYKKGKSFGSRSVDRRLNQRREKREKASRAGRASADARSTAVEHPSNERPTKKKERKEIQKDPPAPPAAGRNHDGFDQFWEAYPKKKGRGAAYKAWQKVRPDAALIGRILAAVAAQKARDPQWSKEEGRFIPYPATWLNQERWSDEAEIPERTASGPKTCESENCMYLLVRPDGLRFPNDCEKCEAAARRV